MENQKRKYAKQLLIILTRANRKIKGIRGRESINGFMPFNLYEKEERMQGKFCLTF